MTTMNIYADRDTPLPESVPEISGIDELLEFVHGDMPRMINAGVENASYHWRNFKIRVEMDHASKKGHIDIICEK